ncbi:polysaccharide pyruvyl transferase family protein [Microbacterium sp. XT11]|uniref:polysaccharide pyruvyl transferase family protein n=1 Tax=Microbacterium sp. XT11 TaxID=367477 RepID=UPI0018DE3DD6
MVVGSANGSGNLGDEAMWYALVASLREQLGEVHVVTDGADGWSAHGMDDVTVLPHLFPSLVAFGRLQRSSNQVVALGARVLGRLGRWTISQSRYARAKTAPLSSLQALWFDALSSCDGLIFSGGGAITDRYAVNGVYAWSLLAVWAKRLGKPIAYVGQGVGPLSARHVPAAVDGLGSSSYLGCRDDRSTQLAHAWGIDWAATEPDWAIRAEPTPQDCAFAENLLQPLKGSKFIAVCLHTIRGATIDSRLREVMKDVTSFAATHGYRVVPVPNMYGTDANDDLATMKRAVRDLSPACRESLHFLDVKLNARQTRAVLGQADLVIATRYHTLVFAGAEGTRTVGVAIDDYWRQKLIGAQASAGQDPIAVANLSSHDSLEELFHTALTSRTCKNTEGPEMLDQSLSKFVRIASA